MRECQVRLVDDRKIWGGGVQSVSSVSNRLLNQEMSIENGITCSYTPGIYAEGYIAFVFSVCIMGKTMSLDYLLSSDLP